MSYFKDKPKGSAILQIRFPKETHITAACKEAVDLAALLGCAVEFYFCGWPIEVTAQSNIDELVASYRKGAFQDTQI